MGQSDLPVARGLKHVAVLKTFGWSVARIKGSHHIMSKPGCRNVLSVPCHKGSDLKRGTLAKILKAAGISEDEYSDSF